MELRTVLDALRAFCPVLVTLVVVPAALLSGHAWVGIVVLIVILCLRKMWWTCVFGLVNLIILYAGIAACLMPIFCSSPTDCAPIKSPNGSLTLIPSVNQSKNDLTKYHCVAFDITDSTGARLHHVQSGASDRMKWAIGWFNDSTVILYSSDIGTRAWKLNDDKSSDEVPYPLPPELIAFGDRLKSEKYGH